MLQIAPRVRLLSRNDWGANTRYPRRGYVVSRAQRTEAYIHHTVIVDSDATKNIWETMTEVIGKARQLQVIRPDLDLDVPYNFVGFLMSDGSLTIIEGRGLDYTGAHTKGHNTSAIALALQGNFELATPSLELYVPLISAFWGWARSACLNLGMLRPARAAVWGHRDKPEQTSCPGRYLYDLLPRITIAVPHTEVPHTETEEEDDMTPEQDKRLIDTVNALTRIQGEVAAIKAMVTGGNLSLSLIKLPANPAWYALFLTDAGWVRRHVPDSRTAVLMGLDGPPREVTPAEMAAIPEKSPLPSLAR